MMKLAAFIVSFCMCIVPATCQQLQWILLSDGSSGDTPSPRRDAALGFDSAFLILYGGRDQSGMPRQDAYAFSIRQGYWEQLNFPNPPTSRYGMATANSIGTGLYIFGGFGMQGSSQFLNPYTGYGTSGLASYKRSSSVTEKETSKAVNKRSTGVENRKSPAAMSKQNFNQMNPMGYNNYNDDDDRADENFYPLSDSWFLSYLTKSWQPTQVSQYGRGFGSAAATPFSSGIPRVVYSMGKSHDWLYSTVETTGQITSGFNPVTGGQSAIIMYDLPSFNPSYPHARYGHSTTLLTDNQLLLYGGCLSGYAKGGPCPSKDSWLLHIDRGHWERLWECPPTKTGAAMVTLPSFSMCAAMEQGMFGGWTGMNAGNEPPVAILWGGREYNPSSIRTYPSPIDEVAVFSLSQKEWFLKRARPSATGGNFPAQREGAAYVAGCFQGMPGMFVYGGRSITNRRLLSDLWFLQASAQDAMNSPGTRSCIYPFSYYHLHGLFQFFAYGIIFPIGYLIGRHGRSCSIQQPAHMITQFLGVAIAICGFSFGVHSVRAPAWLHFKHAHAIIGIITFILTIIQFLIGLFGALCNCRVVGKNDSHMNSNEKSIEKHKIDTKWSGKSTWRIAHTILGLIVLALGLVNICLGVFLAVLPLPVWIIWCIYFGFIVLLIVGLEIVSLCKRLTTGKKADKKPKSALPPSPKHTDSSNEYHPSTVSTSRQNGLRPVPSRRDPSLHRRVDGHSGDDMKPLISTTISQYRPSERECSVPTRPRNGPSESSGFDYYVGYAPEHDQTTSRAPIQQQSEHGFSRVRLQ